MHVHQRLPWHRRCQQRVAAGRILAEARTQCDDQVRRLEPLGEAWIDPEPQVSAIVRIAVVDEILATEARGDRQFMSSGELEHSLAGFRGPTTASDDEQRPLREGKDLAQHLQV